MSLLGWSTLTPPGEAALVLPPLGVLAVPLTQLAVSCPPVMATRCRPLLDTGTASLGNFGDKGCVVVSSQHPAGQKVDRG